MKILAEIVVNQVAILMLDSEIPPDTALRQLEDIGVQLLQATPAEKQAVLEVCRTSNFTLPAHTDPEVRAFLRNFGAEFGLDSN